MPGIISRKIGMTRILEESGVAVPVTVLKCEENIITQVKNKEKDGYDAIVVGTEKLKKPRKTKKYKVLSEFKLDEGHEFKAGEVLKLEDLKGADSVTIIGTSKGKGFQGVIKRHNFSRGPETHGSHHHRRPGSIGQCAAPGKVNKGKKLPGHMGNAKKTIKNVKVMFVDEAKNILAVKGAVPGSINSLIIVKK